jgi:hypothetical protein
MFGFMDNLTHSQLPIFAGGCILLALVLGRWAWTLIVSGMRQEDEEGEE